MKKDVLEKIAEEISTIHNLPDEKAIAIVNKVIKLIGRNGYTITSNLKQKLKNM